MTIDKDGNIILAGTFSGKLSFVQTAPLEASSPTVYLAKFDSDGNHIWSKSFADSLTSAQALATTSKGNIILAGRFKESFTLGDTTHNATEEYDEAVFIAEFDANGAPLWSAMHEDGEQGTDVAAVAVDSSDSVILFGSSYCHQACSLPLERLWLRKYDTNRAVAWSKGFTYTEVGVRRPGSVTIDTSDNILITGCFDESENFGGGLISSNGGADAFAVKFDPAGTQIWARNYGDSASQCGSSIATDRSDNIIVAGTFTGTIRIGTRHYSSIGTQDTFLLKLDTDGSPLWLQTLGNENRTYAPTVTTDALGNIGITAETTGAIGLGGKVLMPGGAADIVLAKFGPDGAHGWSKLLGDAADQRSRALAITDEGEIVLVANVQGAIDTGAGKLFSAGGFDILVAKFAP
ncbi:hypothetical protein [Sorangium sp. So ce542]|uniref:hypothetical protein n=1 Tax=Sorangium sp. So ce542 TaxID=3133316 RepID=UPI003F6066A5